jgi:hypothetical protein
LSNGSSRPWEPKPSPHKGGAESHSTGDAPSNSQAAVLHGRRVDADGVVHDTINDTERKATQEEPSRSVKVERPSFGELNDPLEAFFDLGEETL